MNNLFYIIDQVPEVAKLIALELRKHLEPYNDNISTTAAYKRYGRSWIEKHAKRKNLNPTYRGNKKLYSIAEIERIIAKENTAARLLSRKSI